MRPNDSRQRLLLARESQRGKFVFIMDATLVSQSGKKTQNTFSTGNRGRRRAKKLRYGKKKIIYKHCHSFTFGLLIAPSGIRIPFQRPHDTQEYCQQRSLTHRTTAETAADMIRELPLPNAVNILMTNGLALNIREVLELYSLRWQIELFFKELKYLSERLKTSGGVQKL